MKRTSRLTFGWRVSAAALLVWATPSLALAHPATGVATGLAGGFQHPLSGLDHLAAILAVGMWAAQRGGRAVWAMPLAFLMTMGLGGALALVGVSLPIVEPAIIASVIVVGVLVLTAAPLPTAAMAALAGLFALFHGHAHGSEMPATTSGAAYAIGFLTASTGLLVSGVGFAKVLQSRKGGELIRIAGGAVAAVGVFLCFA